MSLTTIHPSDQAVSRRGISRWAVASLAAVVVVLLVVAWFGWSLHTRLQQADIRLDALSQGLKTLADKQDSLNRDLLQSRDETKAARAQTQAAEERAGRAETAQVQSSREAAQAQAARAMADQQAERARQQALGARQELEQIRRARQDELNRMQEALSKVALTRRTANGMVIDLSNDSFKFDFDKVTLRPENRELLSRLAGVLLVSHGYRLDVYGYTDDIGTDPYNQALSQRRAEAVRDYLVKAGIPPEILTTRGFGKASPRVKAKSADAREKNRRVEIGIVDTVIKYEEEPRPTQ